MSRPVLSAAILALGALCASLWAQPALAEKRVALVIGNSAYQHAPALPNPAKDAKSMAAMFEKGGFAVVTAQYDAGSLQFKRAIRQFEDAAGDADIAVIYYAGHGIEIHGVNYLIPVDAKLASDRDADDEAITLERLVEAADGAKRLRLIILDACRDNPFVRTMKRQRTAALRGINPGLGSIQPTSINTLIAYASKAGSAAEDGDADHSPFTTALLDNLFVPGLDVRLAFGRARDEVLKITGNRQEPYVYGSLGGASISVVTPPEQQPEAVAAPAVSEGEKVDYTLVEKIGTKGAWEVFLTQHPKGFYADLARQQITKLAMAETGTGTIIRSTPQQQMAALEPNKPSKPSGPSSEEQRAWDRIKDSSDADQLRDFIKRFPSSPLANQAQTHLEAIENTAREREEKARQKTEREAAMKRAEEERQRQAQEARANAEREAALKRAQEESKAAEAARAKAEREAARKREEEERQQKIAEAARSKAEREAALKQAREEAKAAEAARAKAEREAALKRQEEERQRKLADAERAKQDACKREEDRFSALQASKSRDDLKQFEQQLTCERLRPVVVAALEQATGGPDVNGSEPVRAAQQELARLGCFGGVIDGSLGASTKAALERYQAQQGRPRTEVEITDALVSELKSQPARVCPLACPPGQVAEGEQCVAEEKSAPVARHRREEQEPESRRHAKHHEEKPAREKARAERERPAPRHEARHSEGRSSSRPQPRVRQEASRSSGGGGGGSNGTTIGVGF
jgi:hypothetical protein